ncbi:MAG: hypothetical protein SGJ24_01150 [Chloroflexota bacterium]|nr:hypothetical protein [Chloroflexota bacterium]
MMTVVIVLCNAFATRAQDATPAVPFADTPPPRLVIQLENDARAATCSAFQRDAFASYFVRAGDTLAALLRDTPDYTPTQIAVLNCIDDPAALPVGAAIFLPAHIGAGDQGVPPRDPLALLGLARFQLTNTCAHDWIDGIGAAPRCPDEPARAIYAVYQPFSEGGMIWFSDTRQIVVLLEDRTFRIFEDGYQEGMPESVLIPPPGMSAPVRGFRLVWDALGGAQGDLGWATLPEQGFDSARQAAGRLSYTTYIAATGGTLALTELPDSTVGFWSAVSAPS